MQEDVIHLDHAGLPGRGTWRVVRNPVSRPGRRAPARLELPEGHARGQPGRADGPRRPARSARDFREKAPNFKILEPAVCNDDPEIAYKQVLEMLHGSEKLVGLYSVGGGTRGTIRALEESQLPTRPAYVCHPLTPATRGGLIRGTVDVIIAPDVPELARATIEMCLRLTEAAHLTKQAAIVPFVIYTSENVGESTGLATMFLGNGKELCLPG